MPIAAFVIDCDGTLVDTEQLWKLAERDTVACWDGAWSEELGDSLTGRTLPESARRIASHLGRPSQHAAVAVHLADAFRARLHAAPVPSREGAARLLAELSARAIPVAVASNGEREDVEAALLSAGLRSLVVSVRCPDRDLRPKPEPDLYLAACRDLDAEPSSSVAIEDARPGVEAGRRAGLLTLGVGPNGDLGLGADRYVGSLWPLDIDALELILAAR